MSPLQEATQLALAGRFKDALGVLETIPAGNSERVAAAILRADVLVSLGKHREARQQTETLLTSKTLTPSQHSSCDRVLAQIEIDFGRFDSAVAHLQRSIKAALAGGDHSSACLSQMKLLTVLSDHSGPEAVVPLLAELRVNTMRAGDPRVTANVHLHVAQMEAKRGLIGNARRHLRLALRLLDRLQSPGLEARAANIEVALAIIGWDFQEGLTWVRRATELADLSGEASCYATSLGNLGNLLYLAGQFEESTEYHERALQSFPPESDGHCAGLESMARIRLAQGRLDECEQLLDQVERSIHWPEKRLRYVYRHTLLTRVNALAKRGRLSDGLACVETVIQLAESAEDRLLMNLAILAKSDLLLRESRMQESLEILDHVSDVASQPPDVYALYEQVLGCALARTDRRDAGLLHIGRARRIYEALHHAPGLLELRWAWQTATEGPGGNPAALLRNEVLPREVPVVDTPEGVLHSLAALFVHSSRPELIARELAELAVGACCVHSAEGIIRNTDGVATSLGLIRGPSALVEPMLEHHLPVGSKGGRTVELALTVRQDTESAATVRAVGLLLASLQELRTARAEREEQATLWPADELPLDDDQVVVSGHMRELMTFARRIARTTVTVLITGESGTGKEILARAVHQFSDRAQKPFVPLNCTAIPRDLLESQLFGHRRGAFTGADRDQAGLIRSARDGTLFLDEIGALSLDLQPKILRFLESGEIAPLGESATLHVNVRVIAATNADLEQAVLDGRFREDLFYRLNIVRLSIRPLRERRDEIPGLIHHFVARAAGEFKKSPLRVAEETIERLLLYRWPGNVRQLQNELRRMVALAEPGSTLRPDAISDDILGALPLLRPTPANGKEIAVPLREKLLPTLARVECEMIKAALLEHHGRVEAVAQALGISRKGLYLKRRRLGL